MSAVKVVMVDNYVPSLNSRYILCYNRRKLKENCCMCKKCLRAKVVEKSEDGNDIWIEFDKNEEL